MIAHDVERHARERPDAIALVAGQERWCYSELADITNRLASGLVERGIRSGAAVGLQLGNTPAFVAALVATARLGAVAVLLDEELTATEAERSLAAGAARRLITKDDCADLIRDGASRTLPAMPAPGQPWLCQFTSGTTGAPMPVVRTQAHAAFALEAFSTAARTSERDCFLAAVPLTHGYGLFNACLAALHAGGTLVLQAKFDRRETLRLIARERVTVFPAVPFMMGILAATRMHDRVDVSSLRLCLTGAARLEPRLWRDVRERLGVELRQVYGTTETGVIAANFDEDIASTHDSVGRALPGIDIAIETESGTRARIGDTGVIAVRSGSAAHADADGWTRTCDLGSLDASGRLFLSGRTTDVLRLAGRTIQRAEIEAVLASHPAVRDVTVTAALDRNGESRIHAIVVADQTCSTEELVQFCRDRLADYKVPRVIERHATIERSQTGKIVAVPDFRPPSSASTAP